jgi:DNA-directed RNA polymerase subunit RPC12/RpoP
MTDHFLESGESISCPKCGKPVLTPKMNVCYIARLDCPHCGALILIEGDKVTVETPSNQP